jgi:hypothetical protein
VYNYPEKTNDLSNQFKYNDFAKAVGGFVKYIIENVNFLTFEEDVDKVIKVLFFILVLCVFFYSGK